MTLKHYILACFLALTGFAYAEDARHSVQNDIRFGELPQHMLDIYLPDTVEPETPVLVFFYGGGFSHGDKAQIRRVGKTFADSGIIVVAPSYRLYPDAAFPDFVNDAALAVSHVWQNLRDEGAGPRPIFIGGWSAGAYISALIAYDGRYLEAAGVPASTIAGFIGLAGPYEGGLCSGETCPHIFPKGTEPDWPTANFVDATDPPMLLVRGTHDLFVDRGNLEDLAASGDAADIAVTTLVVKDAFHDDVLSEMEQPDGLVRDAVDAFMESVLAGRK
ncbi:alpha/beta hydrolase [Aliiroseovarius marinus]|uniref:alpha/beta hydrolase n=1 Tax=Aliiroseovarius marinus TaxID=2500159 RepID=UPI0024955C47|nr:alpha/beta hydrolase [Aliiroseovarius marinus]